MIVPHNSLVLVADGGRCSLFQNRGKGFALDLKLIAEKAQHVPNTARLGTDEPGTSFSSSGGRRASYETTDFHQRAEDDFAVEAAALLDARADESVENIIIVAAPRILGVLRKSYAPRVARRIVAEVDKDYADRPAEDIEKLLGTIKSPHKAG